MFCPVQSRINLDQSHSLNPDQSLIKPSSVPFSPESVPFSYESTSTIRPNFGVSFASPGSWGATNYCYVHPDQLVPVQSCIKPDQPRSVPPVSAAQVQIKPNQPVRFCIHAFFFIRNSSIRNL